MEERKEPVNEKEYLLSKKVECAVCYKEFQYLQIKTNKTRRLEPDLDLRPRNVPVDPLKYGVISCPYCGYSALTKNFPMISQGQRKLIRENICERFRQTQEYPVEYYDYPLAIELHKRSFLNSVEKKSKMSELAYTCLLIAWLNRGYAEEITERAGGEDALKPDEKKRIDMLHAEEEKFLAQAYKGLVDAMANETPPFCGLDMHTVQYLIAALAHHNNEDAVAIRVLSDLIIDKGASSHVKDKARRLKEIIKEEEEA